MSFNHILFFSDKDSEDSYRLIFTEKPPENVLIFRPKGFSGLPSGLEDVAGSATIFVHEVESLSIDDSEEWIANEVQTKPHRVLMEMFEGLKETGFEENIVISIFSGSKLHAALQLTFAMIIDASIQVVQGKPGEKQKIASLDWLNGAMSAGTKKLQQGVLLGMLEAKCSEYSRHMGTQSPYSPENDGWLEAETIVGSQPPETVPDTKGFSATASAMSEAGLLETKSEPSSENREQRYRLTGKGWISALSLWNERNENPLETRYGRISGVMINPKTPNNLSIISIMNTLERVDCWVSIFGMHHDGESVGMCMSSPSSNVTVPLDDETVATYQAALDTWNLALENQETRHVHWAFYDAGQDTESDFTALCEWLWPRLQGSSSDSTSWSFDITQLLINTQLIPAVLFAQSAGLPMTYCLKRSGDSGPSGRNIIRSKLGMRSHVLHMPNRDFLPVFTDNQTSNLQIKHRILLGLLHHDRVRQSQIEDAVDALRDDPFGEIPENSQSMSRYRSYLELKEFIDDEISRSKMSEDYSLPSKPNAKHRQYLRSAQLIVSRQRPGQGAAEEMMLSPIGKLIALYIESKI